LATVILPSLSRYHSAGDKDNFGKTLDWGVRCTILIGVPATIGLFVLAGPMIATLFFSGKFGQQDLLMTQSALMAYALAVLGIMMGKMFSSAFYSTQDIKTPVRISAYILGINVVMNAVLIMKYAHVGLALATSITSLLNAGWLYYKWRSNTNFKFSAGWNKFLVQVIVANVCMVVFLYIFNNELDVWIDMTRFARVMNLLLLVVGSILIYAYTLFLMGLRPQQFILRTAHS